MVIYFSMKTKVVVDEVGRLVLPKEIREAIGVFGRTSVQVEVVNNVAQLSAPEMAGGPVERRGKRTVFGGALPENWDSGEAVLKARESRIRR
jgi:bifunctional DNA-binding transcriptional regulator/antitoxin component of YhaV-PrlF toxin-antitoxin module